MTLGARPGALAAGAENAPQLMLDTGGHMAKVIDLAVTPDGKQLVSASNDKTVQGVGHRDRQDRAHHPWRIGARRLGNDLRHGVVARRPLAGRRRVPQHGPIGRCRRRSACTTSRPGSWRRCSRVTTMSSMRLAFSPDGKRLISGSGDNTAIVWDLTKQQQVPAPFRTCQDHQGRCLHRRRRPRRHRQRGRDLAAVERRRRQADRRNDGAQGRGSADGRGARRAAQANDREIRRVVRRASNPLLSRRPSH